MGDLSESRILIVLITFSGAFAILATLLYGSVGATAPGMRVVQPDEYVEVQNIIKLNYSDVINFTLTNASGSSGFKQFGGWLLQEHWTDQTGQRFTYISKYSHIAFVIKWWQQDGYWMDYTGADIPGFNPVSPFFNYIDDRQVLDETKLDADYASEGKNEYICQFRGPGPTEVNVHFVFNETKYDAPSEAWDMAELDVFWGITWDQVKTAYSAWDIIGMILFWQVPGVDIYTQALISLPVYAGFAYLVFILILRAIGAIFGGGA